MALIGKIRKHFWFVLLLLGLSLAAFILMDISSASNQGGIGPKQIIGEVAGNKIGYRDFQKAENALFSGGKDIYSTRANTWNYFVEKAIVDKEADDLGLDVSVDELQELQFGSNLSPIIKAYFRDKRTGQINQEQLLNVKQSIESGEDLNPDFEMRWAEIQKSIIKTAKQEKLSNLVAKALYTPSYLAEIKGKNDGAKVNFEYVKIPFDKIPDSEVEVTDAAVADYIKEHADKYTNEDETRVVEYGVMDVIATSNDSASIFATLSEMIPVFKSKSIGTEDSLYTINNDGFYSPAYVSSDKLSGPIKDHVTSMNVGDVYGPYLDNGAYFIAKLVGKDIIPDSVSAAHILRSVANGDPVQLKKANKTIDSLMTILKKNPNQFSELAKQFSQDPGSKTKGGDLGTFAQGAMVPAFNNACFIGSEDGGLYKVKTQFGVHLIKVKKRKFNNQNPKYKLAYIRSVIVPSEATQNAVYEKADEIVSANRTLDALAKSGLKLQLSPPLKINDYILGDLGGGETSREIIRWAFDEETNVGEVSPSIYEYQDPVEFYTNKYVIAGLKNINPAGLADAASMKSSLETIVKNQLKGKKLASQISGNDLQAIASANGVEVGNVENLAFSASGTPDLGSEPKVIAAAFNLNEGEVSKPIIGNSGVYVIKVVSKTEGTAPGNVIVKKQQLNSATRGRASFSLLNALKKMFKPKDDRAKYF